MVNKAVAPCSSKDALPERDVHQAWTAWTMIPAAFLVAQMLAFDPEVSSLLTCTDKVQSSKWWAASLMTRCGIAVSALSIFTIYTQHWEAQANQQRYCFAAVPSPQFAVVNVNQTLYRQPKPGPCRWQQSNGGSQVQDTATPTIACPCCCEFRCVHAVKS